MENTLEVLLDIGADLQREMDFPFPNYIRVLCVDDCAMDIDLLTAALNMQGNIIYNVQRASHYNEALDIIIKQQFDIYLVDNKLGPGPDGLELIGECVKKGCFGPYALWTGNTVQYDLFDKAMTTAVVSYIPKIGLENMYSSHILLDNLIRYSIKNFRMWNSLKKFSESYNKVKGNLNSMIDIKNTMPDLTSTVTTTKPNNP